MKLQTAFMVLLAVICCSKISLAYRHAPLVQGIDEVVVEQVQFFSEQQTAARIELKQLQDKLQLDDEWIKSLEKDIEKAAKDLADHASVLLVFGFGTGLNTGLRKAMWGKIEEALPSGKEAAFAEFKEVIVRMQKLRDETAVKGILVFLDNQLCLSEQQVDNLRELYAKNWNSALFEHAGSMPELGLFWGRDAIDLVGEEEFENALSAKQFDAYKSLGQRFNSSKIRLMEPDEVDSNLESAQTSCNKAMDLKIAEYEGLLEVPSQKLKMLSVGCKGVISKVLNQIEEEAGGSRRGMSQ